MAKGLYLNNIIFFLAILTPPQKSAKKWQNGQVLPKYPFFGFFGGIGGKKKSEQCQEVPKWPNFVKIVIFWVFLGGIGGKKNPKSAKKCQNGKIVPI